MHYKLTLRILILAIAGGACTLPTLAQWQWIDKDGKKVFSDRAPLADVLQKNIVKEPGSKAATSVARIASQEDVSAPAMRASAPVKNLNTPKLSGKNTELEARKKQADDLEKTQKQAKAEKLAEVKADNCERVKKGQASLMSGVRISVTNGKGEREFMDDNARLVETRRLQAIADSDCVN